MATTTQTLQPSKLAAWAGWILTALPVLFLLFDGVTHLLSIAPVADSFRQLGYPVGLAVGIGMIELACTLLYALPSTALLGAVLLTGYLGGAVTSHLRVGDPLFSHALFPVYLGVMLWVGLYLRDQRLRMLLPLRRKDDVIMQVNK